MKFKVDLGKNIHIALAEQAGQITQEAAAAVNQIAQETAVDAHEQAKIYAKARLNTTADQYVAALSFNQVADNIWSVTLDKSAEHLESGYCVLYNPKSKDSLQPKVYTIDGWKPLGKIIEGELVLNQHGEFTKVIKIHINPIYNKPIEICKIRRESTRYGNRDIYLYKCTKCGNEEHKPRLSAPKTCNHCVEDFISIKLNNYRTLHLTLDHQVMTERGWIKASELNNTDSVAWWSGNLCEKCNKVCTDQYCSKKCAAAINVPNMIKNGKHFTQIDPNKAKKTWIDNLHKARNSKTNKFVKYCLSKINYSKELIYEYSVKCIKPNGSITYYRLDTYFPALNLGIEFDGSIFHNKHKDRDLDRDLLIKEQHGIDILRITTDDFKKDSKSCIDKAIRFLSNHSGEIKKQISFKKPLSITRNKRSNGFNFTHKWDITVESGESFICQGIIIHNSGFDMKPGLLKNAKKISKQGFKYRSIPMEQKGKGKAGTTAGDLKSDLKRLRGVFGDKGISKGADGKAILGKTLTFKRDQTGRWAMEGAAGTGIERKESGQIAMSNASGFGRNLAGVVKYQYKHASGKVASQFIVYRTVSENPKSASKWMHPGFNGIHAFKDLEQWVHDQLNKRLRELFK